MALRVSPVEYRVAEGGALCNGRRQGSFQTTACISSLLWSLRTRITAALIADCIPGDRERASLPSRFANVRFSFSSCRFGFLGAWSSTHSIGVDLEDQTRNLEAAELAQQLFSQAEAKAVKVVGGLARLRTFCQLWSLKEAALKSIGEGLPFGLDAFEFELTPTLRVVHAPLDYGGPERFDAQIIQGTDICAALVIRSVA
ncbi:MAG: 4'-phosphopantetheinyl transferase superfamily protein [Pseudolabrys sp.]